MLSRCSALLAVFIFCFAPSLCLADDEAVYTGDPRLRVSPRESILPLEVSISIRGKHLLAVYTLRHAAPHSAGTPAESRPEARLDAPERNRFRGAGDWYPDRSYADVVMGLDHALAERRTFSRALFRGEDVTSELAKFGLAPNDCADVDGWLEYRLAFSNTTYAPLLAAGLLSKVGLPHWEAENSYACFLDDGKGMKPGETSRFWYLYRRLPGEFYFSDNEPDRLEVLRKVGLDTWDDMAAVYQGPDRGFEYYVVQWQRVPLWLDDWAGDSGGAAAPKLALSVHPEPVHGRPYQIMLSANGIIYSGLGSLEVEIEAFRQHGDVWLVMFAPLFTVKE